MPSTSICRLIATVLVLVYATRGTACLAQLDSLPTLHGEIRIAENTTALPPSTADESAPKNLGLRNTALIVGGAALVGLYGAQKWWQDGFTGDFKRVNEGWFSQDTDYGGADKLGHAYFSYTSARLLARGFSALGNPPDQSAKLGFWSSLGVIMGVEVLDGFSKEWRFSTQDAFMNLLGAGLGYAMETYPEWDRLMDFRLLYWPSHGSSFDPAGDYSGQTYLAVFKANAFDKLRNHSVLRYLEFAVGYGTREFNEQPPLHPHRLVFVGLSLNLSELLNRSVFRDSTRWHTARRVSETFLEFAQVPGTAMLLRSKL